MSAMVPLDASVLPAGVRSRFVDNGNGLSMHILEAGFEIPGRPCVLLLHGFPELAFSWRKVIPALADAGYHVVAPDQRGYGRTTGWDRRYDGDVEAFRMFNLVRDVVGLVHALGRDHVDAVFGHDSGSFVAGWSALIRPDVFRAVTLMSAPFSGPRPLPLPLGDVPAAPAPDIHAALAALARPRKHYQWYYAGREANDHMWKCPQGVHAFMRAYYHHKSADWTGNRPHRLEGWTADQLALMPTYYIMDLHETMAETVAHEKPSAAQIAACRWLTERELAVYAEEYGRNGYQGGLQWYRCLTDEKYIREQQLFAGRGIDVPSMFIAGTSDWGIYQVPGAIERMRDVVLTDMRGGLHLLEGAGHWVQQEQPEAVSALLLDFLKTVAARPG